MAPFEPMQFHLQANTPSASSSWPRRLGWIGLAVLVHGALLGALLLVPAPAPITPPVPMAVDILHADAPRPVEPPKPHPQPPKPQPVQKSAPKPVVPIVPVSREPSPTALSTQAALTPAQPTPPAAPAAETASAKAAEPAPAPIVQPRFDAAYLNNPAPVYPSMSRRLGETGKVFLRAHVLPSGLPDQVEIRTGSGSPRLDNAALEAVKRWRFVPARQGNDAIAQWVVVPISFNLEN